MERAIKENITGIYNLVNNDTVSKYGLICLFNKYFRNSELNILPSKDVVADKSLVNNRADFSFAVPPYEDMILEMKEWTYSRAYLYPHYLL
jgi:dTDP-4-dehydrorhamnose reductase